MWRIIQFLIYGHIHNWVIQNYCTMTVNQRNSHHRFYLRCEKCGEMKIFEEN